MNNIIFLVKKSFGHWNSKRPGRMGASLSYYAILGMAPLFVLLITFAGVIFGYSAVENKLLFELSALAGTDITNFISQLISYESANATIISTSLGLIILIFGVTGVFRELRRSLNSIWEVDKNEKITKIRSLKHLINELIKHYIPIFLIISILAIIFVLSIMSSFSIQIVGEYIEQIFPNSFPLIKTIEPIFSFVFVALFFATIYRILPKVKLPWLEVAFGAILTATIFLVGELFIGYYLSHFVGNSIFSAAGSFISIMLWVYFSAQVFFFGASFSYIYSKYFGSLSKKSKTIQQ